MNENPLAEIAQDVQSYFKDPEKQELVRDMTQEEMESLLFSLEDTRTWIAILKYTQQRQGFAQSSINVTDPVKEPTSIARNQGIMMGVVDLPNAIIALRARAKRREQELGG